MAELLPPRDDASSMLPLLPLLSDCRGARVPPLPPRRGEVDIAEEEEREEEDEGMSTGNDI